MLLFNHTARSLVLGKSVGRLFETLHCCCPDTSGGIYQIRSRSWLRSARMNCTSILCSIPNELSRLGPAFNLSSNGLHSHCCTCPDTATIIPSRSVAFGLAHDFHFRSTAQTS